MSRRLTKRRRRGAALIEFAVTLPLLVLILFATIEACSMVYLQQSLKIAAYEGVRVALVPGSQTSNVQRAVNQTLTERRIRGSSISITPTNYAEADPGQYVRVTATAPAQGNSLVGAWFFGGRTLSGSVEMMKEL